MEGIEFWVAEVISTDGTFEIFWSSIIWGDGMDAATVLRDAEADARHDEGEPAPGNVLNIYGPFHTAKPAASLAG